MKKLLALFLTFCFSIQMSLALENLDLSVDEEIRKNYKVDDVSLPPLPKVDTNTGNTQTTKKQYKEIEIEPTVEHVKPSGPPLAVIKKGKKFKMKSLSQITDRTRVGTTVSFQLTSPVTTKCFTIPMNTIVYGKVIKSHSPQKTGNGGLIVIRLHSFKMNGKTYYLEGRVLKANYKHIFLNNIKGKRTYMASLPKSMKWGRNCKNKMYKQTAKFSKKKITWILCPFTAIIGTLGYAGNLIFAPLIAIKYTGERIILEKGTDFVFKMTEDLEIY